MEHIINLLKKPVSVVVLCALLLIPFYIFGIQDSTAVRKETQILDKSFATTTRPAPSMAISPTKSQRQPIQLGVVTDDYANRFGGISSVEQTIDKSLSTISIFKQFGHPTNKFLIKEDLEYIKSRNFKLQLSWEPWNPNEGQSQSVDYLKEIPSGKHDDYLRLFVTSIKEFGNPVVMRFGHEMNGNGYPWGNRAEEYRNAYRHIVDFFRKEGVTTVTWMWCVNADNVPYSSIETVANFYPGDDVVDAIGIDGFNFGSTQPSIGWRSFRDIFGNAYNFIRKKYTKPIVIAEVASTEHGGDKAAWVRNMFTVELTSYFPSVQEVVWFNLLKETDWRVNSSNSSAQAFKESIR